MTDRERAAPIGLRTNHRETPLAVDSTPRFTWRYPAPVVSQTAAQVRVATEPAALAGSNHDDPADADSAVVWDTGQREDLDLAVEYDGPTLDPGTRYYWAVRGWDGGEATAWSEPTWFETGLAGATVDAEWIAAPASGDPPTPAPLLRRAVEVDGDVETARLAVSGLGWHEVSINGTRLGEAVLDPPVRDYAERVPYRVFDVSDALEAGENVVGVALGRGRFAEFTESTWAWERAPWNRERPQLWCRLEFVQEDGSVRTIESDESWRSAEGPTVADSLYEGEHYDAREERPGWRERGFDDGDWQSAEIVDAPEGDLHAPECPPVRETDRIEPAAVTHPRDDVAVVDLGQMIAGWVEITVDGPAGHTVELRHGETLDGDGRVGPVQGDGESPLVQPTLTDTIQVTRYTCDGDGAATWSPRFTYMGFRYVEVRNYPGTLTADDLRGVAVHSAIDDGQGADGKCDRGGTFTTSDETLQGIHRNTRWSILNNYHHQPTDTPTYEKNGWTGDAQLTADATCWNFDPAAFYRKWLRDFADAQRESGEVPPIVPTSDWGYHEAPFGGGITSPNPAWDAAYVLVAWDCYRHTGDASILAEHVENLAQLVRYLDGESEDHVATDCLGDWASPDESGNPRPPEGPEIASTAYVYRAADRVRQIADVLDRPAIAEEFEDLAETVGQEIDDRFFDPDTGVYSTGAEGVGYRQTSNVLPLAFGIVPEEHRQDVLAGLVSDVVDRCDRHLDTGILGTRHLLPVLTRSGYVDLAYDVATQDTYPSWGHWIENDATSLFEFWELDSRSRNHHMYGSIESWFYRDLAGIRPAEPGFESVRIEPQVPADLESVAASVETVRGTVASAWEQTGDAFVLDVTVPPTASGRVAVPVDGAETSVRVLDAPSGVEPPTGVREEGRWIARLDPGEWTIRTTE
jgi:alpha-L-rhamnosidase